MTTTDICDQILISLNFSLPNSIEFGAKQWRVVVGVHKLSDKKIAPTFLGWGGFSHQVWGDGKKFQKKTSFIFFHHRIQNHQIRSFWNNLAPSLIRTGFAFWELWQERNVCCEEKVWRSKSFFLNYSSSFLFVQNDLFSIIRFCFIIHPRWFSSVSFDFVLSFVLKDGIKMTSIETFDMENIIQ